MAHFLLGLVPVLVGALEVGVLCLELSLFGFLPFLVPLLSWICGIIPRVANRSSLSENLYAVSEVKRFFIFGLVIVVLVDFLGVFVVWLRFWRFVLWFAGFWRCWFVFLI
jgi:hypothetical protein